jgi:K+-transporting ATPase ATPase C chain
VLTLLTGLIYPLVVTAIGFGLFPHTAGGSLLQRGDLVIGSTLIAQKVQSPRYFWPRPSAADFATVASGASNQGPISDALKQAVGDRRREWGDTAPVELLTASGSGLDPDLSPTGAKYQAARIASERHLGVTEVNSLIDKFTVGSQFGFLGETRVNVLTLNLALDRLK